jgi:hypothetical protein
LLGAEGSTPRARLGLPAEAPTEAVRVAAMEALERWRTAAADPLARRATVDAIDVVVRSCEEMLAGLDRQGSDGVPAQPGPGGARDQ